MKLYLLAFLKKMLENFSSAKMLLFFLPFWVSCLLMWRIVEKTFSIIGVLEKHEATMSLIPQILDILSTSFISWCTFTVSLASAIIVCREVFKVEKIKKLKDMDEVKSMGV